MAEKSHTVKGGEYLRKIAHIYKVDEKKIWGDDRNRKLRSKHPNPNLLCPGDTVVIPLNKREEYGDTEKKHTYKVPKTKALLRILIIDMGGKPVEGEQYKLMVGTEMFTGNTYSGPSKSDEKGQWEAGMIHLEFDVSGEAAVLEFPGLSQMFFFKVGRLCEIDPDHKRNRCAIKGVQARLSNLGFGSGPIDGIVGKKTKAAVHAFQLHLKSNKTKIGYDAGPDDGIPGPLTRTGLKKFYNNL